MSLKSRVKDCNSGQMKPSQNVLKIKTCVDVYGSSSQVIRLEAVKEPLECKFITGIEIIVRLVKNRVWKQSEACESKADERLSAVMA